MTSTGQCWNVQRSLIDYDLWEVSPLLTLGDKGRGGGSGAHQKDAYLRGLMRMQRLLLDPAWLPQRA